MVECKDTLGRTIPAYIEYIGRKSNRLTGLGINNSGEMKMPYGKEDIDYFDESGAKSYIFNGAESTIFRRVRYLMHDDLVAMYQNRESAGAWESEPLIREFDAWQEQFPEELWRLDIERKYMRPYLGVSVDNSIVKTSDRFMKTMMNGRKKYHRRQFERDQAAYMGSKYLAASVTLDQIMFRCNTPTSAVVSPDYTLRIVPYSDMYLSVKFGNSNAVQVRAKAGKTYQINCPYNQMTDTAILIYNASRIQGLNDLSRCYIHDNDFSNAVKLQKLVIGNSTAGYSNGYLDKLTIGNNRLLEILDIQNCPNLTGSLNLSALGSLTTLYAKGTKINAVTFADSGKLVMAYLPNGITAITMRNLNYVETMDVSYDVIERITIDGGVLDTMAIASDVLDTATEIHFGDVNWTMSDTTLLNNLSKISDCYLSGTIKVVGTIGDYELDRYREKWGDVEFDLSEATVIPYYTADFVNDDGTLLERQYVISGSYAVDPVTRADNPIPTPTKEATVQHTFAYKGWDVDPATVVMTANTTFKATYTSTVRSYTVRWFNHKADGSDTLLKSVTALYGDGVVYGDETHGTPEDNTLDIYRQFSLFRGWDKSTGFIRGDTDVYTIYDVVDANDAKAKNLSEMGAADINTLIKDGVLTSNGKETNTVIMDADEINLKLGQDYSFSNVEEHVLVASPRTFDGKSASVYAPEINGKRIYLFDKDKSFTLAIDFAFGQNPDGNELVCCYENNVGFKLRMNGSYAQVRYGPSNQETVASGTTREMVVIRKKEGENKIHVYASNKAALTYTEDELVNTLTRNHEAPLTFGGCMASGNDNYIDTTGTGTIYWSKLWMDDLGEDYARKLAYYPHYTVTMQAHATGGADTDGDGVLDTAAFRTFTVVDTSRRANCTFMMRDLLDILRRMNPTNTNLGSCRDSEMREWLNLKIYNAIPDQWKLVIKKVRVDANEGQEKGGNAEIISSEDFIWIPSYREMMNTTSAPYAYETPEDGYFSMYHVGTTEERQEKRIKHRDNGNGEPYYYWLRSPNAGSSTGFYGVTTAGSVYNYGATNANGVCFGFCV